MDTLIKTVEEKIKSELNLVEYYQKESEKYIKYSKDSQAKADTLQLELKNLMEMKHANEHP